MTFDSGDRNGPRRTVDRDGLLPELDVEQRQRRQRLAPEEIERGGEEQEHGQAHELARLIADRSDIDLGLFGRGRRQLAGRGFRFGDGQSPRLLAPLDRAPDLEPSARHQHLAHGDAVNKECAEDDGDGKQQAIADLRGAVVVAPQRKAGDGERQQRKQRVPDHPRHPQGMRRRQALGDDAAPWVDDARDVERHRNAAGEEREAPETVAQALQAAGVDHAEDEGDRRDDVLQPDGVLVERGARTLAPAEVRGEQPVLGTQMNWIRRRKSSRDATASRPTPTPTVKSAASGG